MLFGKYIFKGFANRGNDEEGNPLFGKGKNPYIPDEEEDSEEDKEQDDFFDNARRPMT